MLSEVSSTPKPLTHPHSERGMEGIHGREGEEGMLTSENETGRDWII